MLQSKQFSEGCSIFDVVLQCYSSLNLLPKLIADNGISNLNTLTSAGQSFIFDTDFVADEFMSNEIAKKDYQLVTGIGFKVPSKENFLLTEATQILDTENSNDFII